MVKVTLEIEIESGELTALATAIRGMITDFGFPEYTYSVHRNDTLLQVVGGSSRRDLGALAFGTPTKHAYRKPASDAPEPPPTVGDIVEVSGIEYVVFSADIEGRLALRPRDELVEDRFLG